MKAAILPALNSPLEVRNDVSLGDLGAGDVHVKIVSSGVCHSDVSAQNGTIPCGFPVRARTRGRGHRAGGRRRRDEREGGRPRDPELRAGLPEVWSLPARPVLSLRTQHGGGDGAPLRDRRQPGQAGFTGLGTFAEELIITEDCLVKVTDDIPLDIVSLIGCGVTTGVGASINTAEVSPGSSVVVFGCGGVGISAIQGARIAGAAEILAVDMVESKLEQAKHFGATHVCTPDAFDQLKAEITAGEGFDYALECIGNPTTIRATFDAARRGGTAVIVGVGRLDQNIQFNAFELFYTDKNLRGSMYGSSNVRTFMPKLLRLWKAGKLDLESMISAAHPARGDQRRLPGHAGRQGDPLGDRLQLSGR